MELNRRDAARASITRQNAFALSDELNNLTLLEVQERLNMLKKLFERFNNEHFAVLENIVQIEDMEPMNVYLDEVETMYLATLVLLKARIEQLRPEPVVQPVQQLPVRAENMEPIGVRGHMNRAAPDICLERITPPVFSGDFAKWSEWKAMFESLVHNHQALTDTQKFHYLKNSVDGDAANVLDGWHTVGENYQPAYDALIHLYENKYRIVLAHIDELHKMPKLINETYEGLRQMIDTTNRALRQLRVIGSPVQHWDHMIIYELLVRMPQTTITNWETSHDLAEMPTLEQVLRYLERRARSIVNLGQQTNQQEQNAIGIGNNGNNNGAKPKTFQKAQPFGNNNKPKPFTSEPSRSPISCHKCGQPHPLNRCEIFRDQMSVDERRAFVRTENLCSNCFSKGHKAGATQCPYGICRRCKNGPHNSMLCKTKVTPIAAVVQKDENEEVHGSDF